MQASAILLLLSLLVGRILAHAAAQPQEDAASERTLRAHSLAMEAEYLRLHENMSMNNPKTKSGKGKGGATKSSKSKNSPKDDKKKKCKSVSSKKSKTGKGKGKVKGKGKGKGDDCDEETRSPSASSAPSSSSSPSASDAPSGGECLYVNFRAPELTLLFLNHACFPHQFPRLHRRPQYPGYQAFRCLPTHRIGTTST